MVDFELIKKLNEELEALLEQRPEYRKLLERIRAEIDEKAGDNKHNRAAMALNIALEKQMEIIPANEKLQEVTKEIQEIAKDLDETET